MLEKIIVGIFLYLLVFLAIGQTFQYLDKKGQYFWLFWATIGLPIIWPYYLKKYLFDLISFRRIFGISSIDSKNTQQWKVKRTLWYLSRQMAFHFATELVAKQEEWHEPDVKNFEKTAKKVKKAFWSARLLAFKQGLDVRESWMDYLSVEPIQKFRKIEDSYYKDQTNF